MKAQLTNVGTEQTPETRILWYCPGCKCSHGVPVPPHAKAWQWNGSLEAPTLSPSVLVTSGHYAPNYQGGACWCSYKAEDGTPAPFGCIRCHCFIRDGRIEFLGDCSHDYVGRTVEMREVES
jgi:hypothetical protein